MQFQTWKGISIRHLTGMPSTWSMPESVKELADGVEAVGRHGAAVVTPVPSDQEEWEVLEAEGASKWTLREAQTAVVATKLGEGWVVASAMQLGRHPRRSMCRCRRRERRHS